MKGTLSFLCVLFLLNNASAKSWWTSETRSHAETLQTTFSNTFASTMIGYCRSRSAKYKHIKGATVEKKRLKVSSTNSGRLPSVFVLQSQKDRPVKAPLMFVLPGAFTTTFSDQAINLSKRFYKMGYHVVVLPNPWGKQFIRERPYYVMGSFIKEGETIYEAMREAHTLFEQRDLIGGQVSVMGISGGGYLTAMMAGLDSISGSPILTGFATSIAAPMIWSQTMKHLNGLMSDVKEDLNMGTVGLLRAYLKVCNSESQDEYDGKTFELAKIMTIKGGFHDPMVNSIKLFDKLNNLNSIPKKGFKKWRKNLNFESFYKKYNPHSLPILNSKWGRIDTWANLAAKNGHNKLRIMVSLDDFLNVPEVFGELNLPKDSFLLLSEGGHWGIRAFGNWFERLMFLTFDPQYNLTEFDSI